MKKIFFLLALLYVPLQAMEQKSAAAEIPNSISIKLPGGADTELNTAELNTNDEDVFESEAFKKLIADQFTKNDSFILARVIDDAGKPDYFDAHNFNFYFFKTVNLSAIRIIDPETGQRLPPPDKVTLAIFNEYGEPGTYPLRFQEIPGMYDRATREYSYLNFFRVPVNKLQIKSTIGVQYFVLRPNKVAEGFQYLCSYTAAKGFHNDVATSPYKGQPQDFFLDYFYANQNSDSNALKQLKAQKKPRIDAFEKKLKEKEEAERKAKESAAVKVTIYLPEYDAQGHQKTEQLDVTENDPYAALSSFQELIDDQKAKNDSFMLARVVDINGKVAYFDAHAFNQAFFSDRLRTIWLQGQGVGNKFFERNRNTMAPGLGNYFENYKIPTNNQPINPIIGVQYFIYDPKTPQNGFQYFATYTKPRGFHNDTAGSPYKGRSQDFFIDYFYANQNEAGLDKLKKDAKARLPELPAAASAAPPAPRPGEQKANIGDLAQFSDRQLEDLAFKADSQRNVAEAIRLFEELYRRMSLRNDDEARSLKTRYATYLAPLYFYSNGDVAPNYDKAKLYYTEMLNDRSVFNRTSAQIKLQEIAAKQQAAGEEEKKNAAQRKIETDLKAAKDLYAAGDQAFNYLNAIEKLLPVYREAPDMQRYEAACLLGEIYFKGGRSVPPDNFKAAEYLQTVHGGPCRARAEELLTQIALDLSRQSPAQPQQPRPGPRPELKADAAAAAQAAIDAQLQEDADIAAAMAASLQSQQPQARPASQAEQKAGRQPAQPAYPAEQKEREAKHVEEQRAPVSVSDDLRLLYNSLQALHAAVR